MITNDTLLTAAEVAEIFHVNPRTVTRWSRGGKLPSAIRTLGGHRRWRAGDVKAAMDKAQEQQASE